MKTSAVLYTALALSAFAHGAAPIRWACIGNSITQGSNGPSYVTRLSALLGEGYLLENDGVSGNTLLKKGDNPYWKNGRLPNVFAFRPDIISIKLGTNDSKPWNWKYGSEFEADLIALVDTLAAMPSHPRIWLVLPCPSFPNNFAIDDAVISNGIIPVIRKVAAAKGLDLIDANTPLKGHPELFGDGVHPNPAGADAIAGAFHRAYAGMTAPTAPPYRIHCGGPDFKDADGHEWVSDAAFAMGGSLSGFTGTVEGTGMPGLYLSERWDNGFARDMAFEYPATDARRYLVRLHFAETHAPAASIGARIFSIRINGEPALDSLDIFEEAGFSKALVKEFRTVPVDGKISIRFESIKDAAKINGMEILADSTVAVGSTGGRLQANALSASSSGSGTLTVGISSLGSYRLKVLDPRGRLCGFRRGRAGEMQVFRGLRTGVYLLEAEVGSGTLRRRFTLVD
ncbi:MAG: axeA1 5 [Fibrobacteres bacterium]|nr:axeA1 5 [Fibrobacterota bacterium]